MPAMAGSSGNSSGLPLGARCTSILRCGSDLNPSMITRSTRDILASNSGSLGSLSPRNSCIRAQRRGGGAQPSVGARPAGGGHQHFGGAGLAVPPGILAGNIDIERVMGVFYHRNPDPFGQKMRDDPRQQGGLAGAAPSREAYHLHHILRAAGGTGLCNVLRCFISANSECHASLRTMMKIDKAPVPLIVPNPGDPRLT